ncbi:MAG: hydroxyneurosporene dehydrogenase [Acidimicrobiales bacterium]|jgi:hypothetical protein
MKQRRNGSIGGCRLADGPEDFRRFGLRSDVIEGWEDGLRTTGGPGSYEWWYFDAHLDDGSALVIAFYTKNPMSPDRPLEPYVTVNLDRPGAVPLVVEDHSPAAQFEASHDHCDVRIGEHTFRGDLRHYEIHVVHDDCVIDVELTSHVPSWRPATGHLLFEGRDEYVFAWLPAVPQGTVSVAVTSGDSTEHFTGVGYHDHNWGDLAMNKLINHWYWGRAQAGPYSIIASHITAEYAYDSAEIPVFLMAKGDNVVADDSSKVRFSVEGERIDEQSGKPIGNAIVYEYELEDESYRVTFHWGQTIVDAQLIDQLSGIKHILARLARFDGSYLRFTGNVQLEHFVAGVKVEDVSDPGIWELMYFGHTSARHDHVDLTAGSPSDERAAS